MADPTFDIDLPRLRVAYDSGLSPSELIRAVYRRIEAAADPGIFISLVNESAAVAEADRLATDNRQSQPLWGVPFAVKDNIDVAGMATTAACPDFAYVPEGSAPVVDRLREAGAILIGKTNLDQFATGLVGVRTPYPVPRNALDDTLVPGGSSSGSAVAVARGLVSFALGTDTAGSGRVPAALNNIVGLKPSLGLLSSRGVVPACRTLDCVSIFAGTVADAWSVLSVAAGYDAENPYSRKLSIGGNSLPPALRIGVPNAASRQFGSEDTESAFDRACALLNDFGTPVRKIDLAPFFATAALLYEGAWVAERYAALRAFFEGKSGSILPLTRQIIEGATRLSAADAFAGQYRLAALRREAEAVWNEIDVLVVPSVPDVCTLQDVATDPIGANSRLGTYTNFVNLLDLCALAVPGPSRDDGLPAGVTLIAPAGRDGVLVAIGDKIHLAANVPIGTTGMLPQPMSVRPATASSGKVEIVVVGAHISGMGLNHELTSRGGEFIRAVATAPAYRLFALSGNGVRRPGLLRVNEGGAAIDTEIWALPVAEFGAFVAMIPAPLGIGTVQLEDGTSIKGFLCEGAAARGARDISDFGGWRAFVRSLG
jgi:allophanate hydrolase